MQPCPRQREDAMVALRDHASRWRDDDTCSYCGSLSPARFFEAIAADAVLGPTDKNYKVYVELPDPQAGLPWIYSVANYRPDGAGWIPMTDELRAQLGHMRPVDLPHNDVWVRVEPKAATRTAKFYFQHLSDEERARFVELLNAGRLRIGPPGHFYRLPFFVILEATWPSKQYRVRESN